MGITVNTIRNWRRTSGPPDDPTKNIDFKEFAKTQFAKNWAFMIEDRFAKDTGATIFALNGVFPFQQFESFQHHDGNSFKYYPMVNDVPDFQVTFYEAEDLRSFTFFLDWIAKIARDDGTYSLPATYKKPYTVFGQNGKNESIYGYEYTGVWPKEITPWEPSGEDKNITTFTVTFSADNVRRLKATGVSDVFSEVSNKVQLSFRPDPNIAWSEAQTAARLKTAQTRGQNLVGSAINIGTAATGATLQIPGIPI